MGRDPNSCIRGQLKLLMVTKATRSLSDRAPLSTTTRDHASASMASSSRITRMDDQTHVCHARIPSCQMSDLDLETAAIFFHMPQDVWSPHHLPSLDSGVLEKIIMKLPPGIQTRCHILSKFWNQHISSNAFKALQAEHDKREEGVALSLEYIWSNTASFTFGLSHAFSFNPRSLDELFNNDHKSLMLGLFKRRTMYLSFLPKSIGFPDWDFTTFGVQDGLLCACNQSLGRASPPVVALCIINPVTQTYVQLPEHQARSSMGDWKIKLEVDSSPGTSFKVYIFMWLNMLREHYGHYTWGLSVYSSDDKNWTFTSGKRTVDRFSFHAPVIYKGVVFILKDDVLGLIEGEGSEKLLQYIDMNTDICGELPRTLHTIENTYFVEHEGRLLFVTEDIYDQYVDPDYYPNLFSEDVIHFGIWVLENRSWKLLTAFFESDPAYSSFVAPLMPYWVTDRIRIKLTGVQVAGDCVYLRIRYYRVKSVQWQSSLDISAILAFNLVEGKWQIVVHDFVEKESGVDYFVFAPRNDLYL